jgi:membrane protein
MEQFKTLFGLLKDTFNEWNQDKAPRLAAALAYYTAFSIAPLLVVVIAIAGLLFSQEAVRGQVDNQIQGLIGPQAADAVQEILANANQPQTGIFATIIGLVTLLLGAGAVFGQLQDALNTIWGVEDVKKQEGIVKLIKDRLLSFSMVLVIGFLLMVSLIVSSVLAAANDWVLGMLPGAQILAQIINIVISFGVITVLFALIYKYLPDTDIQWRDVWIGAAVTALLFTVGKYLLGLYLGNSSVASGYGAAGSFVVLLLWIYYSAQILLFGAEFTQVYANRKGSKVSSPTPMKEAAKQASIVPGALTGAVAHQIAAQQAAPPPKIYPTEAPALPDTRPEARDYLSMGLALVAAFVTFVAGVVLGRERRTE